MRANDLTGMKFGTLTVIKFDKERHENDKLRRKNGEINRVKIFWRICSSLKQLLLQTTLCQVRKERLNDYRKGIIREILMRVTE